MPDIVTSGEDSPRSERRIPVAGALRIEAQSVEDDPGRDGVRIALVAFVVVMSIAGILMVGIIGHRAGFAPAIGVPGIVQSLDTAFVDGLKIPIALFTSIYAAGVRQPMLFAGAMVLLIPPIAALVLARPRQRGVVPNDATKIASAIAASLILIANIVVTIRTINAAELIRETIRDKNPAEMSEWLERLESGASVDAMMLAFSVLICVLVFRLPIDRWVRAIVGTCAIATCVFTLAASAATGGALHGFSAARSTVVLNGSPYYMLGNLPPGGYVLASFAKQRTPEQKSDFENTRLVVFLQDLATPEFSLQLKYEQMNLWDQITQTAKDRPNLDRID